MTSPAAAARSMSEAELLDAVVLAAGFLGWLVHHDRPARTGAGWATAVTGDIGFPDLVLSHPRHGTLFRELKTQRGLLTDQQQVWLEVLSTGGADAGVWRPSDWADGAIERALRGHR